MGKPKYEYMLKMWGSYFNRKGSDPTKPYIGYTYWKTKGEREYFRGLVIDRSLKAGGIVVFDQREGYDVRYKAVSQVIFEYNGKQYPVVYDHGFGYPLSLIHYKWNEGEFSCDSSRSDLINKTHGDIFKDKSAGNEIRLIFCRVKQEKVCGRCNGLKYNKVLAYPTEPLSCGQCGGKGKEYIEFNLIQDDSIVCPDCLDKTITVFKTSLGYYVCNKCSKQFVIE